MNIGFVSICLDEQRVRTLLNDKQEADSVFCFCPDDADQLLQSDEIYFVVSQVAMCSTLLQTTVFHALSLTGHIAQFILMLDEVALPHGFQRLTPLPVRRRIKAEE